MDLGKLVPSTASAPGCRWQRPRGSHCTLDRGEWLVDPPIARNRSSLFGWSTAKGKKTLANQIKMMNNFLDIAYPCIWAELEATTKVIPSLVHLHHAKLTVWTPRPQHRLLRCVASNFTHQTEVILAFEWEIGFEIWRLLMPQLRTEIVFIPTPRSHCWMLWEEGNEVNGATYRQKKKVGWVVDRSACISNKTPPLWSTLKWHEIPIHMFISVD
jgi:hypothetical protein